MSADRPEVLAVIAAALEWERTRSMAIPWSARVAAEQRLAGAVRAMREARAP